MQEIIINNIQWLFSGAGIVIVSFVGKFIYQRIQENKQTLPQNLILKDGKITPLSLKNDLTESELLIARFQTVLKLMNEDRRQIPFTIAKLAKIMGYSKLSDLEKIFTGEKEPSFKFIEKFSKEFGINAEWLTEGKSTPYNSSVESYFDPIEYLDLIISSKPDEIFFVKERSFTSPAEIFSNVVYDVI